MHAWLRKGNRDRRVGKQSSRKAGLNAGLREGMSDQTAGMCG